MISIEKKELNQVIKKNQLQNNDVLLLIAHIFKKNYTSIFFQQKFYFSKNEYQIFESMIARLSKKEPLAKIVEQKEFYSLTYKTNEHTLDPRPETELLIDLFQKYFPNNKQHLEILDLGSGTGCIGLSILAIYQNAICDFVDISKPALDICCENARFCNLEKRATFIESNWFQNITKKYDAILSNPPYIDENYDLDREVLYDPQIALFAGKNGLDAYQKILPNINSYLKNQKIAIIEIGYDQQAQVLCINKNLKVLETRQDIHGLDRAVVFSSC